MFKNYFNFKHFKGDLFGGITAGIVALPLALAFGVSSGLGPTAGLYGAIFIAFFAALFGGTNTQISGPTAPMTAVSMVIIAGIVASFEGDVEKALPSILTVFLLAGIIQITMGFTGIGKYIKYIPYPVVSGFMTAIGLIIIITQLLPIMGYYPKEDKSFVEQFKPQAEAVILENILEEEAGEGLLVLEDFEQTIAEASNVTQEDIKKEAKSLAGKEASGVMGALKLLPKAIMNISWLELLLALGTIIIIYGFKKITTAIPSTLVALVVMTGIALIFNLNYRPIEEIPSGIPLPHFGIITSFDFGTISPYIFSAITLAMLGSIDSLLTSVVADNMTKTKHKPNQELVGQGIGNSIAALFGGIPGAGATIRTVVNIKAGGKTRLSGMVAGVLLLIILLALGPIASMIPSAVLAGILLTVGIGVMDYKGLKAIPSLPRDIKLGPLRFSSEVLIMLIVLVLSTFWNLVNAVFIGLIIAALMFMKKMGDFSAQRTTVKTLSNTEHEPQWEDEKAFPTKLKEEVYIKHLDGPLFFGVTGEIKAMAEEIPDTAHYLVMRMDKVPYIDQSGVYTLEDIFMEMEQKGVRILMVHLQTQPRYMMERIDMIPDLIPEEHVFDDFNEVLTWINQNVKDTI
ncbi:MAG: SulP family inorganic anion transporter [Weeksellaceae bacterium]